MYWFSVVDIYMVQACWYRLMNTFHGCKWIIRWSLNLCWAQIMISNLLTIPGLYIIWMENRLCLLCHADIFSPKGMSISSCMTATLNLVPRHPVSKVTIAWSIMEEHDSETIRIFRMKSIRMWESYWCVILHKSVRRRLFEPWLHLYSIYQGAASSMNDLQTDFRKRRRDCL